MKGAGLAGLAGLAGCIGTGDDEGGSGGGDGSDGSDGSEGSDGSNSSGDDNGDGGGSMASEIDGVGRRRARALTISAEEYESENDATVSVEEFGRSAMKDRLQTNLLSGSGAPAVSMLESVDGPSFIDTGSVAPLTDGSRKRASARISSPESGRRSLLTGTSTRSRGTPARRQSTTGGRCTTNTTSTQTASRRGRTSSKRDRNCRTSSTCSTSRGDLSGVWRYQFRQLSGEPFLERRGEHPQRSRSRGS